MTESFMNVALVQLNSGPDEAANLERAHELFRLAVETEADLVLFPENMAAIFPGRSLNDAAQTLDGPRTQALRSWARDAGVWLLAGSTPESSGDPDRVFNTSLLIDDKGEIAAAYRKLHLFDVNVSPDVCFKESDRVKNGDRIVTADTPWGRIGLTICYDLRFPEMYAELVRRDVRFITVPSAFTYTTGKAHWETLIRARAIDCQCFVLAPNQWGHHGPGRHSFGDTLVVDPWGQIVAQLQEGEGILHAKLDLSAVDRVRDRIPVQMHRGERQADF